MTAPAVIAGSRFMALDMPMRPIPTVPTTVHELPMPNEIAAVIAAAET